MLSSFARFPLSNGEQSVVWSYFGLSLVGAWVAFSTGVSLKEATTALPTVYDLWLAISGAIGASAALFYCRKYFGQADLFGMAKVVIGIAFVSLGAAFIAGTLALPIYGTMFGPLAMLSTFYAHPILAYVWGTALLGVNAAYAHRNREQNAHSEYSVEAKVLV